MKRLYSSILLSLALNTSLNASNNASRIDLFETSPMPGMITSIQVKAGDFVQKGDVLFKMEAMKMETVICAKTSGTVGSLKFREGDSVHFGDVLFNYDDPSLEVAVLAAVGSNGNPPSGDGIGGDSGSRNSGSTGIDFSQLSYFNGYQWVEGKAPDFYYDGFEWLESCTTSSVSAFETRVIDENVATPNEESMLTLALEMADLSTRTEQPDVIYDTPTEIQPAQFKVADAIKWIESSSILMRDPIQLQQSVDSIAIPISVQFENSIPKVENLQLLKTQKSKHSRHMNMAGTDKNLTFKGMANEFIENSQVPHKHNVSFIQNEPIEKSFFQMISKYISDALFDPLVGLLASLMVMFYYMTSLLTQFVAPLFGRRIPTLIRIRA